jgi:hypothetical protein
MRALRQYTDSREILPRCCASKGAFRRASPTQFNDCQTLSPSAFYRQSVAAIRGSFGHSCRLTHNDVYQSPNTKSRMDTL